MNIDTYEVLKAASTKWNFLNFQPGLVGGHCIGVDPYYLTHKAKKIGINPKLILSGRNINDNMSNYICNQILSKFNKKKKLSVNILGATFKENCSDIRNSKVLDIIRFFIRKNHRVKIFDPFINEVKINKINIIQTKTLKQFNKADIIIIAVTHKQFLRLSKNFFIKKINSNGVIFDVKGQFQKLKNLNNNYIYLSL